MRGFTGEIKKGFFHQGVLSPLEVKADFGGATTANLLQIWEENWVFGYSGEERD